jgi:hypothetical protein
MKKEKESIGTAAMHPMALSHLKGQKRMKKVVKEIKASKKHSKENLHHAHEHMKKHMH